MAKLVVVTQGLAGLSIELSSNPTSIGRAHGNALQIIETTVSSRHCEVVLRGNDLHIRDLRSTNGTFVQGQKVTEAVLKPGQTFRVGQVEIHFDTSSAPVLPAGFTPKEAVVATAPVIPKGHVLPPAAPKAHAFPPVIPKQAVAPPPAVPPAVAKLVVPATPVAPAPAQPALPAVSAAAPAPPPPAAPAPVSHAPPVGESKPVVPPLPIAPPPAPPLVTPAGSVARATPASTVPKIELAPPTSKKMHVLFVDDDEEFLATFSELCAAFSDNGWEIYAAPTADRALSTLQKFAIDLVVLDITMPMVDGIQLLGIVGQRYPDVKVAVLTGTASEANRTTCLSKGAELFIEKPGSREGFKVVFNMLNDLVSWTHREGFSGTIRQVGLQEVIQMECLGRHSSVLEVRNLKTHGMIYIESGAMVHATTGTITGEKALQRLLSLSGGQFKLQPFAVPPERTLHGSWEFLLMEAARVRDEETDTTVRTRAAVIAATRAQTQAQTQAQAQPSGVESKPSAEPDSHQPMHTLGDDIVVVATYDSKDGKWNPTGGDKK